MNLSDSLPGHLLTRNGTKYLIVKVSDATVVAAYRDKMGTLQRVLIPLAEALQCIDDISPVYVGDAAEPVTPQFTVVN